MRLSLAAAVMIGFCGTAFAGCPVADIGKALNLPLDGLRAIFCLIDSKGDSQIT